MKRKLIFILLLVCSIFIRAGFGQIMPCGLTLNGSPSIKNIKLGMPRAAYLIALNTYSSGNAEGTDKSANSALFKNVSSVKGKMLDDKIYQFQIIYGGGVAFTGAQGFAKKLSDNLKLPYGAWVFDANTISTAKMDCAEFSVEIDSIRRSITLSDRNAQNKLTGEKRLYKDLNINLEKPIISDKNF